jgi:hypothetical protein
MRSVPIFSMVLAVLLAGHPCSAGESHIALTGGLLVGPQAGTFGPHLKLHRESEQTGLGYGLEIAYAAAGPLPTMRALAVYPAPLGSPRVTHLRVASLMFMGKRFFENPGNGARLVFSVGAGVQDRLTWRSSAGSIGPDHQGRLAVAAGLGLEGTTRLAPTIEFRATTLPLDRGSTVAIGFLVGAGFRP